MPHSVETCKFCFERIVPRDWKPPSILRHSSQNLLHHNADTRLAALSAKVWQSGSQLRCRFLHGTAIQCRFVEKYARIWEQYANIYFRFVTSDDADIRIAFHSGEGSWSAVGTDALCSEYFPKHQPTMNFGWLGDDTDEQEYQRVVLHEFGHALGCVHEHQSPNATLEWNESEILKAYAGPPNFWSEEEIKHNILRRKPASEIHATDFDPFSIMLYNFDGKLFHDGIGTRFNTSLSNKDKEMILHLYPYPPTGPRD